MRSLPRSLLLLSALAVACVNSASLTGRPFSVKEETNVPRGWTRIGLPHPDSKLILRIGLPQPNIHVLEQHLYEISDPDHERYGQHLSKEEVEALVSPHDESLQSVEAWLASFGFEDKDIKRSSAKDWVTVRVPVGIAEKMLDTVRN